MMINVLLLFVWLESKRNFLHLDVQINRFVWSTMTSIFISFFFLIIALPFRYAWHQTLTFEQQFISQHRSYSMFSFCVSLTRMKIKIRLCFIFQGDQSTNDDLKEMKFFLWHRSWAIFGARQRLIFLRPNLTTSSVRNSIETNVFL